MLQVPIISLTLGVLTHPFAVTVARTTAANTSRICLERKDDHVATYKHLGLDFILWSKNGSFWLEAETGLVVNGHVGQRKGTWSDEGHKKDTGLGSLKSDLRLEEAFGYCLRWETRVVFEDGREPREGRMVVKQKRKRADTFLNAAKGSELSKYMYTIGS
jgi:hypothetical protein